MGFCAFARHYLRNHFCFLFLRVMRCFSSPGSPSPWVSDAIARIGLPHSEIHASTGICPYAWLIAACHVLRRLREPRHPSCALLSFLYDLGSSRLNISEARPLKSSFSVTFQRQGVAPCVSRFLFFGLLVCCVASRIPYTKSYAEPSSLPVCQCPLVRVENNGFEPLTPCLQSRCSSQLS